MSNNEMQELSDKLRRGLQLAEQRLLEKNARHGKDFNKVDIQRQAGGCLPRVPQLGHIGKQQRFGAPRHRTGNKSVRQVCLSGRFV